MIRRILLIFFFIQSLILIENSNAKIFIVAEVEGDIITNNDIEKEIEYLKLLNPNLNQLKKEQTFKIAKDALISEIIKKKEIAKFENIGADIGLLFQVADDLIDHRGNSLVAGKKTGKDKKKGKATLISLLGYKNTIKYAHKIILKINNKLKKYGSKSKNLSETLDYILNRNK